MVLSPASTGAQLGFLCLFATLPVMYLWIRRHGDGRLLFSALGLLALSASGFCTALEAPALFSPLLLTAGLALLYSAVRLHTGLRPSVWFVGFLFVSHLLILLLTEPGFLPRVATSHLFWAVFCLAGAARLALGDDAEPAEKNPCLFLVFASQGLFCLAAASACQLGFLGVSQPIDLLFHQIVASAWIVFSGAFVAALVVGDLRLRVFALHAQVKALQKPKALIPICSSCKKARDPLQSWTSLEEHLLEHTDLRFTHSICPHCADQLYPGFSKSLPLKPRFAVQASTAPTPPVLLQNEARARLRNSLPPFPFSEKSDKALTKELAGAE